MIVGCDAAENYTFLEIHNGSKRLGFNVGKSSRIVSFYTFLTGAILNNLIRD